MTTMTEPTFSIARTLRLSSFQIGSAMGDILLAGVWNRIMISDFNVPATAVGLLIALRYFMTPLSLWAGHRSDTQPLWGYRRTSYIWLGRGAIVLSLPLLGFATGRFQTNPADPLAWLLALLCFLMYGTGTLMSGSPYLALVRDSAPKAKQGLALSIVETALIALFPVAAIGFGRFLEQYDPLRFWELILLVMGVGGFFWFFATVRIEKRGQQLPITSPKQVDFGAIFRTIWADARTRRFFLFLFVGIFFAWMQDNILEPFGAEVFDMEVGQTTRFTGYWGTTTVVALLISFVVWRRRPPSQQAIVANVGLTTMALGMMLSLVTAISQIEAMIALALLIFGAGFGLFTFGAFSLMVVMSPDPNSGAYLGLWTMAILVAKGTGTLMGGVIRDVALAVGLSEPVTYAVIFGVAAMGLLVAVGILWGVDVMGFARDTGRLQSEPELQLAGLGD